MKRTSSFTKPAPKPVVSIQKEPEKKVVVPEKKPVIIDEEQRKRDVAIREIETKREEERKKADEFYVKKIILFTNMNIQVIQLLLLTVLLKVNP